MLRRLVFVSILVTLAFAVSGCVIAIGTGGGKRDKDCLHPHNTEIAISEIEAAGRLFSDSDKTSVYKGIAQRPGLSGKAQAYLIKESCRRVFSDSSKEEVLIALIANPCFDDAGKRAVLANLNRLFSDSRKRRILEAINARETRLAEAVQTEVVIEASAETTQ